MNQRDKKMGAVEYSSEMLDSMSEVSLKCFSLFQEKTEENLDLYLNQLIYSKGRICQLPYLNYKAFSWILNFIVKNYLRENQNIKGIYKIHNFVYNSALINNYMIELYVKCIDKLLSIKLYSGETFERFLKLINQHKAVNKWKISRKIDVLKMMLEECPSKMELIIENVIKEEYSLKVLSFLLTVIEDHIIQWSERALKTFKWRMSKKYGVVEEESISLFKINILIQNTTISRGFKDDRPSYSTEKKHISRLNLSSCRLDKFPLEISKFTHLKELWLVNNNLKELPESINQLKYLELLMLRNNPLKGIPNILINSNRLKIRF